jgi:hypothetical protein
MIDVLAAEMEEDRREAQEFAMADERQRKFMEWRQVWDCLKYCLIALALALFLAVQLVSVFATTNAANGSSCDKETMEALSHQAAKSATDEAVVLWMKELQKNNFTAPSPLYAEYDDD